jgi:hypothetical protein
MLERERRGGREERRKEKETEGKRKGGKEIKYRTLVKC